MTDPLRFPIGRPELRTPLSREERAEKIDRIRRLPGRLRSVVSGLSDELLDAHYREGGWTVRQVIHHLPDSHANGYIRFKLGVTEDSPTVRGYQEAVWAELPEARTGDIELSLPILEALHRRWTVFLGDLPDEAWSRTVVYSDGRTLTLDELLCIYSWHGDHHLAHITGLLQGEGG